MCSRNVEAEAAASVWGSSSSGISSSDRGGLQCVCVFGFCVCFSLCEPGRAETVDSRLVVSMVSLLKLWPGGWVCSFPHSPRALLLRLVLVPTCLPVRAFLLRNALKLLLDLKRLALAKSLTE